MRKWAEVIKAWADGAVIQYRDTNSTFLGWRDNREDATPPFCVEYYEFRVKPVVVVRYGAAGEAVYAGLSTKRGPMDNLKLTFEDGKLVAAEVLS